MLYWVACADFKRILDKAKLPKIDSFKEEGREFAEKKKLCAKYRKAKEKMQTVTMAKVNIDYLLGYTEPGRKKNRSVRDCENKERRDATTSGQVGPKRRVWGGSPTSRFLRSGRKAGTSKIAGVATPALLAV